MKHTQYLAAAVLAGGLCWAGPSVAQADSWGHRYRHDHRPRYAEPACSPRGYGHFKHRHAHRGHRHAPVVYVPVRPSPVSFRERAHASYQARAANLSEFYLHVSDRGTAFGIALGR